MQTLYDTHLAAIARNAGAATCHRAVGVGMARRERSSLKAVLSGFSAGENPALVTRCACE